MADKPSRSAGRSTGHNNGTIGVDRRGGLAGDCTPCRVGGDFGDGASEPGIGPERSGRTRRLEDPDAGLVVLGLFPEVCLAPGHPALHTVAELSFLQFTDGVDAFVVTDAAPRRCRRIAAEQQFGIAVLSERDVALASRLGLDFGSVEDSRSPNATIVLVEPSKDVHETWPIRNPAESRIVAALHERINEHRQLTDRYGSHP